MEPHEFKIIDCVKKGENEYEFFVSFLGVRRKDQVAIHEWLMNKVFLSQQSHDPA
jgi:hypothetical protein